MTDGAKEWVTLRVPAEDRDEAKATRPDGATYGDCVVAGARALAGEPDDPTATAEVDAEDIRDAIGDALTIDVTIDASDLDLPRGDGVTREDVEAIVERKVERELEAAAWGGR